MSAFLHAVVGWLTATHAVSGWAVPNWFTLACLVVYVLWEFWLGRTKKLVANSTLELVVHFIKALLGKIPWAALVEQKIDDAEAAWQRYQATPIEPPPPKINQGAQGFILLVGLAPLMMACALAPIDQAKVTLATMDRSVTTLKNAFVAFNVAHEEDIADGARASCAQEPAETFQACAKSRGEPAMAAWHVQRAPLRTSLRTAGAGLNFAHDAVEAVQLGAKPISTLDAALAVLPPIIADALRIAVELGIVSQSLASVVTTVSAAGAAGLITVVGGGAK